MPKTQLSEDFIPCDICNQILELDNSIRFAGFANNMGRIIAARYRNKLDPLLTVDESELSFIESVLRMSTRIDMRTKLGKPIYSSTLYQKVKRATILLDNKDYPMPMVSFENDNFGTFHESIIMNGILPLVSYDMTRICL
ncbi:MAG: hypothetical protein WCF23_10310 [Candidatus Nitrosopolaris sp.]